MEGRFNQPPKKCSDKKTYFKRMVSSTKKARTGDKKTAEKSRISKKLLIFIPFEHRIDFIRSADEKNFLLETSQQDGPTSQGDGGMSQLVEPLFVGLQLGLEGLVPDELGCDGLCIPGKRIITSSKSSHLPV